MRKKLLIVILVLLVLGLVGGAYSWWMIRSKSTALSTVTEEAVADIQEAVESVNADASQGVLPNLDAAIVNPMEDIPDINPYKNTNPFSDIKTNPFE